MELLAYLEKNSEFDGKNPFCFHERHRKVNKRQVPNFLPTFIGYLGEINANQSQRYGIQLFREKGRNFEEIGTQIQTCTGLQTLGSTQPIPWNTHASIYWRTKSMLPVHRERSGRVLDSGPKGRGFEPYWRHCVVVLEQDTFILA